MKTNYLFNPNSYEDFIRLFRTGNRNCIVGQKWGIIRYTLNYELSYTEKDYPSYFNIPLITEQKKSLDLDENGHSQFTSAIFNFAFIQELESVFKTKIKTSLTHACRV